MAADKTEVTEKLPAPSLKRLPIRRQDFRRICVGRREGATSYEASVAQQTRPDFRKTVETEDSNASSPIWNPALYLYRQGALRRECGIQFRPDAEGRGTLGFAAEKLATPTELAAADVTSSGAKISWAEVSGAANYRVVVKTTSDGQEVASTIVGATSYTAAGSRPVRIMRFGSGACRRRLRGE